jgi:MFS family permease
VLLPLRPLAHRDFAVLWAAALLSNIGTWMQIVGVGVLVTARTGQAEWTAIVAAAATLPMALLTPVGGVLADRHDRRTVLLATTAAEMAMAAALTALAGSHHAGPVWVTLFVLGGSVAAALGMPAFQTMLPDLARRDELAAAISLNSAQFNIGRVLGPVAAAVVIAGGGYVWAFALNATSFAAVLAALLVVRAPARVAAAARGGVWRSLVTGSREAWREPGCRLAIIIVTAAGLAISPFISLIPAMAVIVLHGGSSATSLLTTAQGAGAVAGAFAVPLLIRRFGRPAVVIGAALGVAVLVAGYGLAPGLAVAVPALLLVGAAYIALVAALTTVVQARAPGEFRGRIVGAFMTVFTAAFAIGSLAQGAVADRVGLRAGMVVVAAVFGAGVGLLAWRRRDHLAQLGDPAPAGTAPGDETPPPSPVPATGGADDV